MSKKVVLKINEAQKISKDMSNATTEQSFDTLVVGKTVEQMGKGIFSRAKNHIEENVSVDDVKDLLAKPIADNVYRKEFISYDTLFGVDYEFGGHKLVLERGIKNLILDELPLTNPILYNDFIKNGVIETKPEINYDKLRGFIEAHGSIPTSLASKVKFKSTDATVLISSMKEYTDGKH